MRQARQAPETCARAAVPQFPLGALELADWMTAEVVAGHTGAKAARCLQGVLETHGDMKPVEDESRVWYDLTLQLP